MKRVLALLLILLSASAFGQLTAKVIARPILAAPSAGTASAGSHSVALGWTQSAGGTGMTITGNKVYRANGTCPQATYTAIYTSSTPIVAYSDSTVVGLATYCYVVTAVATCPTCSPSTGESGYSNAAQAVIPGDSAPNPPPPTGLTVGLVSQNQVPLFWQAPATQPGYDVVAYEVMRWPTSQRPNPKRVAIVPSWLTAYTDSAPAGSMNYAIEAYDIFQDSLFALSPMSNMVRLTVPQ